MSLKAEHISKLYGKQKALDSVSFEIKTGEIVGFLGPNGAGKSTMMKIITGYIEANEGQVFVNNMNINSDILEIRKQIGYLPEHNPLYLEMYVKEYLNFVAKIYKLENVKENTARIIEMTGLSLEQHKKIGALSKGYRQRVGLAAALIHNPAVLILDEPTTGLDPNQIIEIRNLIQEIGKEKTVMLSTHIMQEVEAICDRVIIINQGKIVADKPVERIKESLNNDLQTVSVEFDKPVDKEKLASVKLAKNLKRVSDTKWLIETDAEEDIRPHIFKFAVAQDLILLSMQREEKSLEDVFIELTGKK